MLPPFLGKRGVSFHCFADETQLYLPLKLNDSKALQSVLVCLTDLKLWMSLNVLNLNESETEIVVFCPP